MIKESFSIFSVSNKMSEVVLSDSLEGVGKLVTMSVVRVREERKLKSSVMSFGSFSCWLRYANK